MRFDFLDLNSGDFVDLDVEVLSEMAACFEASASTAAAASFSWDPLLLNMTGKLMAKIKNPVSTPMSVHGE